MAGRVDHNQLTSIGTSTMLQPPPSLVECFDGRLGGEPRLKYWRTLRLLRYRAPFVHDLVREQDVSQRDQIRFAAPRTWKTDRNYRQDIHGYPWPEPDPIGVDRSDSSKK